MTEQKRSERLRPVARLAEEEEHSAARELGERRQLLQQHQRQLEELESYRAEYLERLQQAAHQGIGAVQLRHYHSFVAKLSEAIAQQQRVVQAAQQEVTRASQQWQHTHTRVKMVDTVITSCQAEELQGELRTEQKETDERALRGFRR